MNRPMHCSLRGRRKTGREEEGERGRNSTDTRMRDAWIPLARGHTPDQLAQKYGPSCSRFSKFCSWASAKNLYVEKSVVYFNLASYVV